MTVTPENRGFQVADIAAAFSLLSRLPVPVDHTRAGERERAAVATWAYPLVGALLGAIAALLGNLALWLGAPAGISAALVLAALALMTGAMHEDGLADCADGIGGGNSREQRLKIMKDSRIGAFGAVALAIALIARWSGIEGLAGAGVLFWPLVAVGAASRLPMVVAMFFIEPARRDGLSSGIGMPPPRALAGAIGVALAICILSMGFQGLAVVIWAALAPLPLWFWAQARLGGQTGDVLGASQQMAEIGALAAVAALII
ncbi:MAG: adenosylcobinamide-GDP ribazoletransferase [Paracoccaceae bacterium]